VAEGGRLEPGTSLCANCGHDTLHVTVPEAAGEWPARATLACARCPGGLCILPNREPGPRHAAAADDLGQPFSPADLRAIADQARVLVAEYDKAVKVMPSDGGANLWLHRAVAVLREVAR
jgi:hypothetical protein